MRNTISATWAVMALYLLGLPSRWPECAVQANVTPDPGPLITLDPPRVELGMIFDSFETSIPVVVKNRSNLPVDIADVKANCIDCIRFEFESDRSHLEPEESTLLLLFLDPRAMRGDVRIFVAVVTGDPNEPQRTLEINAFVRPTYQVTGGPVAFSKIIQGYPQTWRVAVEPHIESDNPLDQVVSKLPGFSGTVRYDETRKQYLVEIVAGENLAPGQYETSLSLQSSTGEAAPCVIPVGATVQEPFLVVPDRLTVAPRSQEQLRMIVLEHHLNPPLRVTSIELPGPNCRYKLYKEDNSFKTWLNLYFYNVNRFGVEGDIVIHTNHPSYPRIVVPVTIQDVATAPIKRSCSSCPSAKTATRGRTKTR